MTLRIGLLAWRVERGGSVDAFARRLDAELAVAARAGAELVMLPEYAALEAAFAGAPDLAGELARAVEQAPALLEAARTIAGRHGLWLLGGTWPVRDGNRVVNRAHLIAPDGRMATQDKHVMTRFEAEEWGVAPGAPPHVFETPWGRLGVAICFDAEFPTLVRAQVEAGAWLVLVPSCTETMHGFSRVRISAAARAMENQCFVAMAPTVGLAPWSAALDANRGYAAVFGPADRGFPEDGVIARGALDQHGWVFADLDAARIQAVRRDGSVLNHVRWPTIVPASDVVTPARPRSGAAAPAGERQPHRTQAE